MNTKYFIAFISLVVNSNIFSGSSHFHPDKMICDGFFPDPKISASNPAVGYQNDGITKEEYENRNNLALKAYSPLVEKYDAKFVLLADWSDDTSFAGARKQGSEWAVKMTGGVARTKNMTADAYNIILCHEVGHLVGGFPFYPGPQDVSAMASEGNSDYFASFDCFYRLFKDDQENNEKAENEATTTVKNLCQQSHDDKTKQQICMRSMSAGLKIWQIMLGDDDAVKIGKKDPKVAKKTIYGHPKPQCRVNTFTAGSLCPKPYFDDNNFPINLEEMDSLTCGAEEFGTDYLKGVRPQCWFNRDVIETEYPEPTDFSKLPGTWISNSCKNVTTDDKQYSYKNDVKYSHTFNREGVIKNLIYVYSDLDCKGEGKLDSELSHTERFIYGLFKDKNDPIRDLDRTGIYSGDTESTIYTSVKVEEKDGKLFMRLGVPSEGRDGKSPETRMIQLEEEPSFEKK